MSIMFPHKVKPPVVVILRQEVLFSQCPFSLVQSNAGRYIKPMLAQTFNPRSR